MPTFGQKAAAFEAVNVMSIVPFELGFLKFKVAAQRGSVPVQSAFSVRMSPNVVSVHCPKKGVEAHALEAPPVVDEVLSDPHPMASERAIKLKMFKYFIFDFSNSSNNQTK